MRVTAFTTILSSFFIGLGFVQVAVGGDEPGTVPAQVLTVDVGATPVAAGTVVDGPARPVSVDANGTREWQNEEYGRKVKITDDPQNGIKVVKTTHKGGTDETATIEAKDATELEKKSPSSFKLYQKYMGNQGQANAGLAQGITIAGGPIQIGGGQLQLVGPSPAPFPMPGPGGPPRPVVRNVQVFAAPGLVQGNLAPPTPVEIVTTLMGQLSSGIESEAKNNMWKYVSKDDKESIKKQAEALKKQLDVFEKQFEEK